MLSMDNKKGMSEGGGNHFFNSQKILKLKNKKVPKFVCG
jgi:hypothetical protein